MLLGNFPLPKNVNAEGFIDLPSNEEWQAKSEKILRDRAKFQKQNRQSKARNSNNTTWELKGPTFMKRTNGTFANEHINVYSITQCLTNTDVLYCVTEDGGTVFKTTDNGLNWFSVSDNLITNMGSRNIEVTPSNPDIVYLCAGHDIYKTTVGGHTWTSVYNSTNVGNLTLIIHPTNSDIVMAGGNKGILKSIECITKRWLNN